MQVPGKGIRKADVSTTSFVVVGIAADITEVEIEQAVPVVIEKHRTRGMADVVDARRLRDVFEMTTSVVLKEDGSATDGRDEEILIAVVVDIRKRCGHADSVSEADTSFGRYVPETASSEILPNLAAAELADEIQIDQPIA